MKKLKIFFSTTLILSSVFLFYSCDIGNNLDAPVSGKLKRSDLSGKKGVNALLIGAYGALGGQNIINDSRPWTTSGDNWIYGSVAGGMAGKGSTAGDQAPIATLSRMEATSSSSFLNDKWVADYEGIARTNTVIIAVENAKDIEDGQKKEIIAEARFLRGHYYFDLTKMFGKVPWIDQNTKDLKQPNDSLVWPHIEKDFKFAYNNLPAVQSKVGKANKWAAASYLGKSYLFQKKYMEAKQILDKTISNGVTAAGEPYALVDHFEDNFRAQSEQNSETVFSIQFTANDGTGTAANARKGDALNYPYGRGAPTNCCGFFNPTEDLVNSFRTNAEGLPMPDSYNNKMISSEQIVSSSDHFSLYQGNLDPRLDWTLARRGVPFHDYGPYPGQIWIRSSSYDEPHWGLKHMFWKVTENKYRDRNTSYGAGTAVNYAIIRFDDVILMAAEADANLGDLNSARQLINRIRSRVADDTYGDGWVSYKLNEPYALASVGNQSAMTSLDANAGDWVIRTDKHDTFQLLKSPASNPDNWNEYKDPNYKISIYPSGSSAFSSKSSAIKAIHFERRLELALEGHRFFDLVRWDEAKQKLDAFYRYEGDKLGYPEWTGASFITNKNEHYPIPQRQIDLTRKNGKPTLKQNPGYK